MTLLRLKNRVITTKNFLILLFFAFLAGSYYFTSASAFGKEFSIRGITLSLLGGLGLFLWGMEGMSRGLQKLAGNRLKGILRKLSGNRFMGVLTGTIVTAIVQSSTVTTVMLVGFVNSGLLTLLQATGVMLGANIGTTITGQIIAFNIHEYALSFIGIGALVTLFTQREYLKSFGESLFSLGILFLGLKLLGEAFDPLSEKHAFENLIISFSNFPIFGVLTGVLLTILLQSSSVTVGMTIALALSGLISFEAAVPLILGENIGTTVTSNIAAIGGSRAAKITARAHFVVKLLGVSFVLLFLHPFMELTKTLSGGAETAHLIANAHTFFNIGIAILFLPLLGFVLKLSSFLVFGKRKQEELYYLEESALEVPGSAIDSVKSALSEMLSSALNFLKLLPQSLFQYREQDLFVMSELREKLDRYQSRVTEYLEKIAVKKLSAEDSACITDYVRCLHEIERISDYEAKMREVAIRLKREARAFGPFEKKEIKTYFRDVIDFLKKTEQAFAKEDKTLAKTIMHLHRRLYEKKEELREKNTIRFSGGDIEIAEANYYFDIVSALEEISKKCHNIAATILD